MVYELHLNKVINVFVLQLKLFFFINFLPPYLSSFCTM